MDNRIKSSLAGHTIKINWKSPKKIQELYKLGDKVADSSANFQKAIMEEEDASKIEELTEKEKHTLTDYYKESAKVMFDFEGGFPNDEFWEDEDFPQGEMEYNQKLFFNPTIKM